MNQLKPYLRCQAAAAAIDFYQRAFGARELFRLTEADGKVAHAELALGNDVFYLSDPYPEFGCLAPEPGADTFVSLHWDVDNVDAVVSTARQHGATLLREPRDEFYGCRGAVLRDPFGHRWMLNQLLVPMSPEEMQRQYEALRGGATA